MVQQLDSNLYSPTTSLCSAARICDEGSAMGRRRSGLILKLFPLMNPLPRRSCPEPPAPKEPLSVEPETKPLSEPFRELLRESVPLPLKEPPPTAARVQQMQSSTGYTMSKQSEGHEGVESQCSTLPGTL